MARRYEKGMLVGEPDPPKTLGEILSWCTEQHAHAVLLRDREAITSTTRCYLSGRAAMAGELLDLLQAAV